MPFPKPYTAAEKKGMKKGKKASGAMGGGKKMKKGYGY